MKIRTNADLSTLRLASVLALAGLFGGPPAPAQITFERHLIDQNGPGDIWGKGVGDLDGDGRTDFIVAGRSGLVWYKSPQWTRWPIDTAGWFSTDVEAGDIDRDGAVDVVVVHDSGLRWYRNGGTGWVMHPIGTDGVHDVEIGDFDGDGDLDAVARNQGNFGGSGRTLYLYLQNSPTAWVRSTIAIPDGEGLKAADLDQDGDLDFVVTGNWYENTGGAFLAHSYTTTYTQASIFIDVADLNGDGRLDIVVTPSELAGQTYRVSWFEAPVDPKGGTFSEHVIEANVEAVHHFVGVGDFDCDGDLDVASAEMTQGADPDEIKIYVNSNRGASWTKQVLGTTGSHSMRVVDADLDGDLDLFGGNWDDTVVEWWENTGCPPPGPGDLDGDGDVDLDDFAVFAACLNGPYGAPAGGCTAPADLDGDTDVDMNDLAAFQTFYGG
jgi:hypothetical protein